MYLFKWSDSYLIHIPELDQEHQELFRSADSLHRSIQAGAIAMPYLEEILEHVSGHFTHEERIMRAARYPSLAWHKRQHDVARTKSAALARKARRGDLEAASDLLHFLSPWLKDHISVADKMMAASLRNYQRLRTIRVAS